MKERPILFSGPMVHAIIGDRKTQTRRAVRNMPKVVSPSVCKIVSGLHPFAPSALVGTPAEGKLGGDDRNAWIAEDWCGNPIGVEELSWLNSIYGAVGDRLWVKETFSAHGAFGTGGRVIYRADIPDEKEPHGLHWKPSIFMPRKASRITLEVEAVRVEPLQSITTDDIIAEGVTYPVEKVSENQGKPLIRITGKCPPADYLPRMADSERIDTALINHDTLLRAHWASLWESINGAGSWAANPWVWVITFKRLH